MTASVRVRAYVVGAVMVLAVAWPITWDSHRDSFPLSTYPMFSFARQRAETLSSVVVQTPAGEIVRLSSPLISGGSETTLASVTVINAINGGQDKTDELCREVAQRLAGSADHAGGDVLVVTERWDVVDYLQGGRTPEKRTVHTTCPVPAWSAFDRWYLRDAPPERIAVLRVLVGAFAFIYTAIRLPDLWGYSDFSESRFRAVGVTGLLDEPLSPTAWHGLLVATLVLAVAFAVGWKYRVIAPVFAVVLLFETTYHDSFGQLFHTENLMVLFVLVLAVAPAADAYAFDRRTTVRQPGPQYGWPLVLLSVITVITYVLAGWAKIANGGMGWLDGDVLLNQIAFDNVRKAVMGDPYSALGAWMVGNAWLFPPIAVVAVLVELAAPVALLGGRWRNVWVIAAWLFHAGTAAVMYISFPFPLFAIAFAPFYEIERIPVWLAADAPARFRPATT